MKLDKIIFISIVLIFALSTSWNLLIFSNTFIPKGEGTEAWINDLTIEKVEDKHNIHLSFSIKNVNYYDKPILYEISFHNSTIDSAYSLGHTIVDAESTLEVTNYFILEEKFDKIKIEFSTSNNCEISLSGALIDE